MHKCRQNNNGSFSIGKTWDLDHLSKIQSFTNLAPKDAQEQQAKQLAGDVGFTITIQKPYYWKANTSKEKDFFIYSLVKIFKKYTGGKSPELIGFSSAELGQFEGIQSQKAGSPSRTPQSTAAQIEANAAIGRESPSRVEKPTRNQTAETNGVGSRHPSSQDPQSRGFGQRSRPSQESTRLQDASLSPRPNHDHQIRQVDSQEQMQRMPGHFPSSEFVQNLKPQGSTNLQPSPRAPSPSGAPARGDIPYQGRGIDSQRRPESRTRDTYLNGQELISDRSGVRSKPSSDSMGRSTPHSQTSLRDHIRNTSSSGAPIPPALTPGLSGKFDISQDRDSDSRRPPISKQVSSGSRIEPEPERPPPSRGFEPSRPPDQVPTKDPPRPSTRDHQESLVGSVPKHKRSESKDPSLQEKAANGNNAISGPATSEPNGSIQQPAVLTPRSQGPDPLDAGVKGALGSRPETPNSIPATPLSPPEMPSEEIHRPGLGPMIKKRSNKDIANIFRKAATAHNAFKPRAGGAADKLRGEKEKADNEPDGITGVVPAPILRSPLPPGGPSPGPTLFSPGPATPDVVQPSPLLKLTTSPPKAISTTPAVNTPEPTVPSPEPAPIQRNESPPIRRPKPKMSHFAKYAKVLDIPPEILEDRTIEIESIFDDLGWGDDPKNRCTYEDLQMNMRKELSRIEAGSYLGGLEHGDDRLSVIDEMMNRVMAECEEMDNLLTLYKVELGTLSEDVAYIEAQSQGLQVQTANQKLLQMELRNLLETISISSGDLDVLRDASLTKTQGIEAVEATLAQLYTAMMTIDPRLWRQGDRTTLTEQPNASRTSLNTYAGSELSTMQAVRDKKEGYRRASASFIYRMRQYLSVKFREMEAETQNALEQSRGTSMGKDSGKLNWRIRENPKRDLWQYSPLLLFARVVEQAEWEEILHMYQGNSKRPYQDEFRDNILQWKRATRKAAAEDADVLFTSQEKETENIVGRKLTVKRAKTVRTDGPVRISPGETSQDGKVNAYEAFSNVLYELCGAIFIEQNCIVDLFHATSIETLDFTDAITTSPEARTATDLSEKKPYDPDRAMAKKVSGAMEDIFSFVSSDLQNLVEWVIKQDALQAVGVLFCLEFKLADLEDTSQEYLTSTLSRIHDRLAGQFSRFVEEQIRGIEDTKVKIKKRKGVISFMRTFPNFSASVENMFPSTPAANTMPVRRMVDTAYQSINKTMFESLKFIAKESPSSSIPASTGGASSLASASATGSTDPAEDKELLNYHILLIENMNHYVEEIHPSVTNAVLLHWRSRAQTDMNEHLDLYISSVIRRPLGKLLDYLESTENLLANPIYAADPTTISTRASHSKSSWRKVVSGYYDAKELRKGVEALKKRVEKHFGEGDDPILSRSLVGKVLRECERRYEEVEERVKKVAVEAYGEEEIGWKGEEVQVAFKR